MQENQFTNSDAYLEYLDEREDWIASESGGTSVTEGFYEEEPGYEEEYIDEGESEWNYVHQLNFASLFLGLVVVAIFLMSYLSVKSNRATVEILRLVLIPVIIAGAVLLTLVGYSEQQITGALGLMGMVAGYLLGKSESAMHQGHASTRPASNAPSAEVKSGDSAELQ